MVRKSRYPNALDVRQVVTAERVAKIAGADTDAARVVINAHLFGLVAMAASGATVVSRERGVDGPPDSAVQKFVKKNVMTLLTDTAEGVRLADVVAASMPSNSPTPRYDPVFGADLLLLTESLARGYVPDISTADVDAIMETWWNLCDEAPPGLCFVEPGR